MIALLMAALLGAAPQHTSHSLLDKQFKVTVTGDILFAEAPVKPSGKTLPLRLDLYAPADDGPELRPAVILVHGGGFTRGNRKSTNIVELCNELAARGFVCISIDYRLEADQPDVPGPDPRYRAVLGSMQDTEVALEWTLDHSDQYRIAKDRIAFGGASAGATSALLAGYANPAGLPQVRAVIDMWGGLGGPVSMITKGKPPLLIIHGTEDPEVPFSEAQKMVKQAEKIGLPYKLIAVSGAGHGIPLSREIDRKSLYLHIAEFLVQYME